MSNPRKQELLSRSNLDLVVGNWIAGEEESDFVGERKFSRMMDDRVREKHRNFASTFFFS